VRCAHAGQLETARQRWTMPRQDRIQTLRRQLHDGSLEFGMPRVFPAAFRIEATVPYTHASVANALSGCVKFPGLLDEALGRNSQLTVQAPDHIQGKWSLMVQHLVNAIATAEYRLQVFRR